MDKRDAERVVQNLMTKPFICTGSSILLDDGYVILRRGDYEELKMSWEVMQKHER